MTRFWTRFAPAAIPKKATRLKLSAKAYTHTAEYDAMIAAYMRAQGV